jgi:predicted transcriptional regulator of viral defense system
MVTISRYINDVRAHGQRYFTVEQAMTDLGRSRQSILNSLAKLQQQGDLISPARGMYVIVPPQNKTYGSIPADELVAILMKHFKADYYVACLSAAEFHGAAHQKAGTFQVISNRHFYHKLEFGRIKIETIYKKDLKDLPIYKAETNAGYLKVASPELTAFDLFFYPERCGGLNHIATVLSELIEVIDAEKLIALASQIGSKAWLQRMGYILEHIEPMEEEKAKVIAKHIAKYLQDKIKCFVPLSGKNKQAGYTRNEKWKIIENTEIEADI